MYNRRSKNWNNFALGVLVLLLPFLALPDNLAKWIYAACGFLIALFSLAQVGPSNHDQTSPPAL